MTQIIGAAKAQRALRKNLSPRYLRMDRLERYVLGTQYSHLPSFWNQSVPLHDRAPLIVYPIIHAAIRSNVDLCIGEGRWPDITSFVEEDDSEFGDLYGLSQDDSEKLDKAVDIICSQARLKAVCRQLLVDAQACGTAVVICSIRNGKVCTDTTKAKWCKPTFDTARPEIVESLEIRYPYLKEYFDEEEQKWGVRCMLYRRLIDEQNDTTFMPIEALESGREPDPAAWVVDPDKTVAHKLGFCPVRWYPFLRDCTTVAEYDGTAVHQHITDEVDSLNFGLSQRHAAAMLASSPPVIETGVDEGEGPDADGRAAVSMFLPSEWTEGMGMAPDDPANKHWVNASPSGVPGGARRRGPGAIWRYPNKDSKVSQLTMSGDALKPIEDDCRDLRSKIAEALAYVFSDFENARSTVDVSGRALREHHRRQIERCDVIRDDFGQNCLLPLLDMLMRLTLSQPPARLRIPGIAKFAPILKRFEETVVLDNGEQVPEWTPPSLQLIWPDYFEPSEADQKFVGDSTIALLNAGVITKRTAVARISQFYEINNVDEYMDTLEDEAAEKQQKALEQAQDMAKTAGPPQPGQPPNGKPPAAKPAFGQPAKAAPQ